MTETKTFLWLTGHQRNVGDSMLRRPYAEYISQVSEIRVWADDITEGYIGGLRLDAASLSPSFASWYKEFARQAIRGNANFVFNAGEFVVTKSYFVGIMALWPWILLAKLRGGKVVWVGAGISRIRRGFFAPFKMLAKISDVLYWRDTTSSQLAGTGKSAPDWGFALESGGTTSVLGEYASNNFPGFDARNTVCISLRGDRPYPGAEWIDAIRDLAQRTNLKVVTVSQVMDDNDYAERLAGELKAECVLWPGGDHFEQEIRVREAYRSAAVAFSDRLHGLIIAATEGAVPLGWTEATTSKLARHFDLVGSHWTKPGENMIEAINNLTIETLGTLFKKNSRIIEQARVDIKNVAIEIQQAINFPSDRK